MNGLNRTRQQRAMVLGLGSKSRKGKDRTVHIEFEIRLLEIKPWQGLNSLKPVTSVILHWKRGDKHSGNTKSVVPQVGTGSDVGKIVFNESFRLPATLYRESTRKSNKTSANTTAFQEKCVVFDLYEGQTPKGQPLGRATLNLAPYGEIEGYHDTSIPLAVSRKVVTKGGMPNILLALGPFQENKLSGPLGSKISASSLPSTYSQSSRTSDDFSSIAVDEHNQESLVAALLSDEDEDIASFTDDESSRSSSTPTPPTAPQNKAATPASGPNLQSGSLERSMKSPLQQVIKKAPMVTSMVTGSAPQASPVKAAAAAAAAAYAPKRSFLSRDGGSSRASSNDFFSEPGSPDAEGFFTPSSYGAMSPIVVIKSPAGAALNSSPTMKITKPVDVQEAPKEGEKKKGIDVKPSLAKVENGFQEPLKVTKADATKYEHLEKKVAETAVEKSVNDDQKQLMQKSGREFSPAGKDNNSKNMEDSKRKNIGEDPKRLAELGRKSVTENSTQVLEAKQGQKPMQTIDMKPVKFLPDKQSNAEVKKKETEKSKVNIAQKVSVIDNKLDSLTIRESETTVVAKEMGVLEEARLKFAKGAEERNEKIEKKALEEAKMKVAQAEAKVEVAETEVRRLGMQVERLKGELLDTAADEAALYSIVAEHGSSFQKVHSPARRLARLYIYGCKHWSQERRASSARNYVSGLVLAARACGHDVPRLTYWWSNAVVLRETISSTFDLLPTFSSSETSASRSNLGGISRSGQGATVGKAEANRNLDRHGSQKHVIRNDWREPITLLATLERLEAWIFAKVVESVWWQALTPHMQKSAEPAWQENNMVDVFGEEKNHSDRSNGKNLSGPELGDGRQGNMSIDLWKKAFSNAFERLCPVRAVGVECGCLPMLAKLIVEECVARLDVAMFNAILRGSEDDAPTDPVSDPISDLQVLPIPTGNLSFGAGAQLKNAVYTWSTWLTNLASNEGASSAVENSAEDVENSLITFPLLKATGDVLMLPKDMLMDKSIRKEVFPVLSLSLIKKVLLTFVPDEFSPDPLSPSLLAAINAEISMEKRMHGDAEDCSMAAQGIVAAPPIIYTAPQSTSVREWIGDLNNCTRFGRTNSSLLRKGHTSDDELDDLESPICWLIANSTGLVSGNPGSIDPTSGHIEGLCANVNPKNTSNDPVEGVGMNQRFKLLRELWTVE